MHEVHLFPKLQPFSISNDETNYLLLVVGPGVGVVCRRRAPASLKGRQPQSYPQGKHGLNTAMVKDIIPWICSWRDVLGLQAQSSHKESSGCSVGFGSMPHEAIFPIPAVLRKLFDILRDREPCCPWDKADCSFWQHVPHPTSPADSAHSEQISLPCHSALRCS